MAPSSRIEIITPLPSPDGIEAIDDINNPLYGTIRDFVFCLMILIVLFIVGYVLLSNLLKQSNTLYEQLFVEAVAAGPQHGRRRPRTPTFEHQPTFLPLVLCSFALAVSMATALLVLFEISIDDLRFLPKGWMSWLTADLLEAYWSRIFWGSNMSLVLVLFSYFYCEAEGFSGNRGLSGRLCEASLTVTMVSLLIFGIFYLAQSVWSVTSEAYLPFSFSFISFLGSLIFLVVAPIGFVSLINKSFQLRTPINLWDGVRQDVDALELERSSLQYRLSSLHDEAQRDPLSRELLETTQSLRAKQKVLKQSILFRNAACALLLAITVLMPSNILLRVLLRNWYDAIVPYLGHILFKIFVVGLDADIAVTQTVIELVLCMYFIIASTVGAVEIPDRLRTLRGLRLQLRRTSMQVLCVYSGFFLVTSASIPIVTNVLGITRFDLMGHYHQQWGQLTRLVYNVVFLASTSLTLFTTARKIYESW